MSRATVFRASRIRAAAFASSILALACLPAAAGAAPADPQPAAAPAPVSVAASLSLARAFRSAGDLRSAIYLYRDLLARKGADPAIRVELGDTLVEAGLIDDAISTYGQVDPKSKEEAGAQLGMAAAELRLGNATKALAYVDQALASRPGDEAAQVARGVALDNLGRHAEAQASYRAALAIQPRSIVARSDLALSLAITGQYQQAIDLLGPIARSANATPRLRQNLALVYGLKGDKATAVALGRADLDLDAAEANADFFDTVRHTAK